MKLTSDREPYFTAAYWSDMTSFLGISRNNSTSYHPKTFMKSYNSILTLSSTLRGTIKEYLQHWDRYLPELEFELNASLHHSTKLAPFEVDIGRIMLRPHTRALSDSTIILSAAEYALLCDAFVLRPP